MLEKGFVVSALLLFMGALTPLLQGRQAGEVDPNSAVEGSPVIQALFFGVYVVTFLLGIPRWKGIVWMVTKEKLLLVLVSIAVASVSWSAAPAITLRRSVALLGTTFFGVYLARRYSLKEQLRLLAWALGIAAVFSVLFAVVLPTGGAWQGVFVHKNTLGLYMALGAVVFFLLARSSYRYRWVLWVVFCLSVGLLLLSTSKTALVTFLILLALMPLYGALRWHYTLRDLFLITLILVGGGLAVWFVENLELFLGAIGKDVTLTGRTVLWYIVFDKIWQHPWLGYGYSGFWVGSNVLEVWSMMPWQPKHAHNGFLDLWLSLGLLGLSVYLLQFLMSCVRAVAWLRLTKTAEGLWPLLYLTLIVFINMTLSVVLEQNNILWVLYVAMILSMAAERGLANETVFPSTTLRKGR